MSSVPALALDNGVPELAEQARTRRLSDAEKIGSDRLDSASISSLKAALAGVTAKDALPGPPRLVERIDAAAKLAAEATAAAQAVETLKRLLQAQLATSPAAATASGAAATKPSAVLAISETSQAAPSLPSEQRRPDVRGFFAGFVLSGAIGAVLYLYMMAG
jgi:hypothetical protein